MNDPWADFNGGNELRRYYSTDGTLVYEVGFTIEGGWESQFWNVSLTPEQAYRVRDALTQLEANGVVAWWRVEVRSVYIDDLSQLGDELRKLTKEVQDAENTTASASAKPGRGRVREPEA